MKKIWKDPNGELWALRTSEDCRLNCPYTPGRQTTCGDKCAGYNEDMRYRIDYIGKDRVRAATCWERTIGHLITKDDEEQGANMNLKRLKEILALFPAEMDDEKEVKCEVWGGLFSIDQINVINSKVVIRLKGDKEQP